FANQVQTREDVGSSDAQGPAWPESPGVGLAWVGSGSGFCKPKPKPSNRAWSGRAWAWARAFELLRALCPTYQFQVK
ncbi:hypothetical protein B0H12DRAFT_1093018, partial [Mycena haematopus]